MTQTTPHKPFYPFLQVADALNHPQNPTKERIRAEHQEKINRLDNVYEKI